MALAVALSGASALAQTTVTLLASIELPPADAGTPRPLTLADVAILDGPDADALARIVLVENPRSRAATSSPGFQLDVAEVRDALTAAKVHWGKTALRGSRCYVKLPLPPADPANAGAARPARASAPARPSRDEPQPVAITGDGSVRDAVVARLLTLFAVDAADLRLAFEPADTPLLATPIAGRRAEIHPAATGNSPVVPVQVFLYDADRIALSGRVQASALIARPVAIAREAVARGTVLDDSLFDTDRRWLAPNTRQPADPASLAGRVTSLRVNAGAVIGLADTEAPLAVRRGEIVEVHVLSGSITVRAQARALANARDGELVQLRLDGSDTPFTARMNGRARAVMVVDAQAPSAADAPAHDVDNAGARPRTLSRKRPSR
jgi:flagella basal body P-ring formation protein FlgA